MKRYNFEEPSRLSVFRSRDLSCHHVSDHKETIPMGYVDNLNEFDGFVKLEHPNAKKVESVAHRGSGGYYYTDGSYNIFYHTVSKLNTL